MMNRRKFIAQSAAMGAVMQLPLSLSQAGISPQLWDKARFWAPQIDGDVPSVLSSWFKIDADTAGRIFDQLLRDNILTASEALPAFPTMPKHSIASVEKLRSAYEKVKEFAADEDFEEDEADEPT